MAKTKTTPAVVPAPEPASEPLPNRYLRSARIIIEDGCGIDKAELAVKASMSEATAGHCLDAYKAVCLALREAKLLPAKKLPAKAPVAPEAPQTAAEPVPAK